MVADISSTGPLADQLVSLELDFEDLPGWTYSVGRVRQTRARSLETWDHADYRDSSMSPWTALAGERMGVIVRSGEVLQVQQSVI